MEPQDNPSDESENDLEQGSFIDRMRHWLNMHTVTVTIFSNIVLLCALTVIVLYVKPRAVPPWPMAYYYDLSTDSVFVARTGELPPVFTPQSRGYGKRNGVRAYVFSCGDCSKNDTKRFIGYLEAFTDETKSRISDAGGNRLGSPFMPMEGHLYASPDDREKWVSASSEESRTIWAKVTQKCGGTQPPRACSAEEDPAWRP